MQNNTEIISTISEMLQKIQSDIKKINLLLESIQNGHTHIDSSKLELIKNESTKLNTYIENEIQIIEGIFDGYFMIGADSKKYPVPLNYSSKSKIIQGDQLKLRITTDGSMIYKVVKQIDRKNIKGVLSKSEDGKFVGVGLDDMIYELNQAAVSFFGGAVGDELIMITSANEASTYAAIEVIVKKDT